MWTRGQLKTNARQLFLRNYWAYVAVALLAGLFTNGGSSAWSGVSNSYETQQGYADGMFISILVVIALVIAVIAVVAGIFVGNVLLVGANVFYIRNRTEKAQIRTMLEPFQSGHYLNVVGTMFLMDLYIFLWTLLFIIPGVIKSYEYMMVPYILAENPGMDRKEVFAISKRMMDGQKWDAFVLSLSFLGWLLLSGVTCGIVGVFWTQPYIGATTTELYLYNKMKAYNEGYIR